MLFLCFFFQITLCVTGMLLAVISLFCQVTVSVIAMCVAIFDMIK
jgi:hypothetical protein